MSHFNTNILFIHIPKNAGTTLKSILLDYNFILTGHNIDFNWIQTNQLKTLVVIRDPISRFISSVNYSINNAQNELLSDHILKHIRCPNDWAEAMFDTNHVLYSDVWNAMYNNKPSKIHRLDNKILTYRWHWSHQCLWVRNPTYVILYHDLYKEFLLFLNHLSTTTIDIVLPHRNQSFGADYISDSNKQKIYDFYQQDLDLYTRYQAVDLNTRLNIGCQNIFDNIFDIKK